VGLVLVEGPTEEPISLEQAKIQLREDQGDNDTLISALIVAARQLAENNMRRAIMPQTWRLSLDSFPVGGIVLPRPPLISVTSVSYLDAAGDRQVLAEGGYRVQTSEHEAVVRPLYGQCWPQARRDAESVQVEYRAGYADAVAVPAAIKQWLLLCIGTWYANRESATSSKLETLPRGHWDSLLDAYTVWGYE